MMKTLNTLFGAVLAGIFISLGGFAYLKLGGLAGAIMFSFGLISIIHYKLALFTGKAGFFKSFGELADLFLIVLLGNFIGCLLTSAVLSPLMSVSEQATEVYMSRVSRQIYDLFFPRQVIDVLLLAVPCGLIMTTCVEFARKGKFLPLLFGVPLFIVCGFIHSIADAFYYSCGMVSTSYTLEFPFRYWLASVAGNFIGCNIPRAMDMFKESDPTEILKS